MDPRGPALQTVTRQAVYHITFLDAVDTTELRRAVADAMLAEHIMRKRRDKAYDLRPLIHGLEIEQAGEGDGSVLVATLNLSEAATGRPDELLEELGQTDRSAALTARADRIEAARDDSPEG